jgi:transposase
MSEKTSTRASIQFSKKVIRQAVQEVEDGSSRKEVCSRYGIAYTTIGDWMKRYGSPAYIAQKRKSFSSAQRRSIARSVQEGRITIQEVALVYRVDRKLVRSWIRAVKQEEHDLVCINQEDMTAIPTNAAGIVDQKELEEARLKIKALELMIDIAEEQFKISIRKKSGAKQLQK